MQRRWRKILSMHSETAPTGNIDIWRKLAAQICWLLLAISCLLLLYIALNVWLANSYAQNAASADSASIALQKIRGQSSSTFASLYATIGLSINCLFLFAAGLAGWVANKNARSKAHQPTFVISIVLGSLLGVLPFVLTPFAMFANWPVEPPV